MKTILYCLSGYLMYEIFGILDGYELIFWGFLGIMNYLDDLLDKK